MNRYFRNLAKRSGFGEPGQGEQVPATLERSVETIVAPPPGPAFLPPDVSGRNSEVKPGPRPHDTGGNEAGPSGLSASPDSTKPMPDAHRKGRAEQPEGSIRPPGSSSVSRTQARDGAQSRHSGEWHSTRRVPPDVIETVHTETGRRRAETPRRPSEERILDSRGGSRADESSLRSGPHTDSGRSTGTYRNGSVWNREPVRSEKVAVRHGRRSGRPDVPPSSEHTGSVLEDRATRPRGTGQETDETPFTGSARRSAGKNGGRHEQSGKESGRQMVREKPDSEQVSVSIGRVVLDVRQPTPAARKSKARSGPIARSGMSSLHRHYVKGW